MGSVKPWLALVCFVGAAAAGSSAHANAFAGFSNLDRQSHDSLVGLDLGLGLIDFDDGESLRMELHGQYLIDGGVGVYGMVPFSRLFVDVPFFDNSMALGNLEAGAFYIAPAGDLDLVLRGGVALPTADSNFSGITTNALAHAVRITDAALAYPDTTWLRLSGSPMLTSGDFFLRMDIGLDVPVRTDVDADPLIRFNVGGGFDLDRLSLMGELALNFDTDGDDYVASAITARFHGRQFEPGLSIIVPINDNLRDVIDLGLLFSMQVRLD
jgi:hypothetical protein